MNTRKIQKFQKGVLAWFSLHKRDLPWRRTAEPWLVLMSEIMLQQTQVERVIPKFLEFARRWPTSDAMAQAPLSDVLRAWSGLGYNRRGASLWKAARAISERHAGRVPRDLSALEDLPGIGRYTARAVLSFAWNDDVSLWDTNVRRIAMRVFHGGEFATDLPGQDDLEKLLDKALPIGRSREWHGALMDLGSAVCAGKKPMCRSCPLSRSCRAASGFIAGRKPKTDLIRRQSAFEGSARQVRGAILRELAAVKGGKSLSGLAKGHSRQAVRRAAGELAAEGLISSRGDKVSLPID